MGMLTELLYAPESRNMPLRERIETEWTVNRNSGQVAAYEYLSKSRISKRVTTKIDRKGEES
jgi:hypothetical protein